MVQIRLQRRMEELKSLNGSWRIVQINLLSLPQEWVDEAKVSLNALGRTFAGRPDLNHPPTSVGKFRKLGDANM